MNLQSNVEVGQDDWEVKEGGIRLSYKTTVKAMTCYGAGKVKETM